MIQQKTFYPLCSADAELACLLRANYKLLYVVTWEEERVISGLEQICNMPQVNLNGVMVWDVAKGLVDLSGCSVADTEEMSNPENVIDYIANQVMETAVTSKANEERHGRESRGPVYVLCDLFRYLGDRLTPNIERKLRSLSETLRSSSISVIIVSPELCLPTALQKVITVVDYPLPGVEQLRILFHRAKTMLLNRKRISEEAAAVSEESVLRALLGLTMGEAEDALAKAIIAKDGFDIPTILEIKRQIIRKGEMLDYVHSNETMDNVGGLAGIKQWIKVRKNAFGADARKYGLPAPKGVFLLGVQGTGKSLCAKAIANELQVPLLKFDIGKCFSSYIGESESNVRQAIKLAESIAPCVFYIDELDMAMSGSTEGTNDNGVTKRVISALLDWMQEKTSPVFVVAAANSTKGIPPAMLRRGRFDELFFVDLPTVAERGQIFGIHLSKPPRARTASSFNITALAAATSGYSGAEIEAVIIDAMNNAYSDGAREFTTDDVLSAIRLCKPLSEIMKTEIDKLRDENRNRMRLAGTIAGDSVVPPTESRFEAI